MHLTTTRTAGAEGKIVKNHFILQHTQKDAEPSSTSANSRESMKLLYTVHVYRFMFSAGNTISTIQLFVQFFIFNSMA